MKIEIEVQSRHLGAIVENQICDWQNNSRRLNEFFALVLSAVRERTEAQSAESEQFELLLDGLDEALKDPPAVRDLTDGGGDDGGRA